MAIVRRMAQIAAELKFRPEELVASIEWPVLSKS
jgi:hypothetical protein